MKQNRICFLAAAAAVLLGTAACNNVKEKEFDPNDPAVFTIAATPDAQSIAAEGGDLVFNFNAPDYWFVSSPVDWLTFEPESGKPGPVTLTVKANQNIKGVRDALITVTSRYDRGKFSISQEAWPYYHEWAVYGTIGGGATAQDLAMEDQSEQLVWKRSGIPFHFGETFQFRMTGSDAVILGLGGALVPVEGARDTYTGSLVKGGDQVTFPVEGFWDVTLDVENWTMTAALASRYPWTMVGTIAEGSWDQDVDMADMGRQLVWEITKVPFHKGEEFKFRREKNDAVNLGIDGEFAPVEGQENTYAVSLKQDGGNIALPGEGYWTLHLDVEAATLTATLTEEFPKAHQGVIWENDGSVGAIAWSSTYRLALDGRDPNGEALATLPEEVWNQLKTQTCYLVVEGANPQIRLTTGWWSTNYTADDIQPGNEALKDNGDGTWTLKFNLSENPGLVELLDQQHFLMTGDRYTPLGIYPENAWANDGTHGAIAWSSEYRFGLEGRDPNKECLAVFPETIWNKIKTETFYLDVEATDPYFRITTGWWSTNWTGGDLGPWSDCVKDNGDGTFTVTINMVGDSILDLLDQQHLLFTGERYTPLRIRMQW